MAQTSTLEEQINRQKKQLARIGLQQQPLL